MDFYFTKGDHLPLPNTKKLYHTTHRLKKGDITNPLNIFILEGESRNPLNNDYIAETGIDGKDLPHDIPEGAEIEITLSSDESNDISAEWYLPIIDKGGNFRCTTMDEDISPDDLRNKLEFIRQKAASVEKDCSEDEKEAIESKIIEATKSIENAEVDEEARRKTGKEIKELGQSLEEIEESKKLPNLKDGFKKKIEDVTQIISEVGLQENKESDLKKLSALEVDGKEAIKNEDRVMLSRTIDQIFELGISVVFSNPQVWVYRFNEIKQGDYKFSDPIEAKYYIEKGDRAIGNEDIDELKACVVGLNGLLTVSEVEAINKKVSGIMK
jgi:hypothetical protein